MTDVKNINKTLNQRNYGVDLLRLLAMLFVVILHILGRGGVLENASNISCDLGYLLEIFASCAVNIYAIISGYVIYTEKEKMFKHSKYISIWIPVFFYSFSIGLIAFLLKGTDIISIKELFKSAMPVTFYKYWYFSSYTGLFFIIPFLNKFMQKLSTKETTILISILFFTFSCYGFLTDPFKLDRGYSLIWLIIMYLFGAFFKKCSIPQKVKTSYAITALIICILITWFIYNFSPIFNRAFLIYPSPTIVLSALCWLIIFSKLNIKNSLQSIIKFTSPAAFGVYLIHEQTIIRDNFITNKFIWICDYQLWLIPIITIGCALAIFLICLTIEIIRINLFKLLRINKLIDMISCKVEILIQKFLDFLTKHIA